MLLADAQDYQANGQTEVAKCFRDYGDHDWFMPDGHVRHLGDTSRLLPCENPLTLRDPLNKSKGKLPAEDAIKKELGAT